MKGPFIVFLLCVLANLSAQPTGKWYALLSAGAQSLPLELDLRADGGTLSSPRQSPAPIPLSDVTVVGDSLSIAVASIGMTFGGRLSGDTLTGIFRQGLFSTPLTFYRTPPPEDDSGKSGQQPRPQDPTEFPYRRDTVSFPGGGEGVRLSGELTRPEGSSSAVVVLISGSGPQDRNEELAAPIDHRPFLVLSDHLTRSGYAVLRYDDRGVGESTGSFSAATSADFAEDVAAAVGYLRAREEFAELPLGLIGHSEGGMIAPMVAMASPEIDFLVLLAAPGLPIDSLMLEQRRQLMGGDSPEQPVLRAVYGYAKEHPEQESVAFADGIRRTVGYALPQLDSTFRSAIADTAAFSANFLGMVQTPWMRYFLAFEPATYLEKVTVPVLAINGEKDRQVTATENLQAIGEALDRAGNDDVTLLELPGLNHLFQPADTGMPAEYGRITTTLDPALLERVTNWLNRRYR